MRGKRSAQGDRHKLPMPPSYKSSLVTTRDVIAGAPLSLERRQKNAWLSRV
jgi:hypothetical protein